MIRALLPLALFASPVSAQIVSPLNPASIDTSNLPTKADVQAANDAAAAAVAAAAAKCAPMAAVPPTEVIGGSAGSGANCRLSNAIQPRITRSVAFTTGSDGTAAVTWTTLGAVPLVFPVANVAVNATQVPACYPIIGTITATGATIKCFITQTVLGLGLVPFTSASSGVTGQVLAIPVS